jgi:4'-phosphopantetheinyl transferase EntD
MTRAGAGVALAFARTVPFGRLVGVALPAADDDAGVAALALALAPEEAAHARGLARPRRATFVGGRVALRAALAELGLDAEAAGPVGPILPTPRGAPALPGGVAGSIAHKPALAVALAARAADGVTLGVDLEVDLPPRFDIAPRVLTEAERARVDALPTPARARAVLRAFAAKEAVYKAIDPWLGRYVGFRELEVDERVARFAPRAGEPRFDIELDEQPLAGHVLVTARVQRRAG